MVGDDELAVAEREVNKAVFLVCLRMSTFKESPKDFMSPSTFGDIIYENWLFDIPKIFDLCVLYGRKNTALLTRMVGNIFKEQGSYYDDLSATTALVVDALSRFSEKLGVTYTLSVDEDDTPVAPLLKHDEHAVKDFLEYLLDIARTLTAFLTIHGAGARQLRTHRIGLHLVGLYASSIPSFEQFINTSGPNLASLLRTTSESIREFYCLYFRLAFGGDDGTEEMLDHLDIVIKFERFIRDYGREYAIVEDIQGLLPKVSGSVDDQVRLEYVIKRLEHELQPEPEPQTAPAHDPGSEVSMQCVCKCS